MSSSLEGHLHRFCGGRYQGGTETVTVRLSGMSATVERGFYRCAKCGDEQRTVEQRETAERAALERIRAEHGLLAPREIKQLRESIGLTAVQMGELLYGTPKGVIEGWERGRYLQNREADAMLRSFRDREALERRAAKAGVVLPTPEQIVERQLAERARLAAARGAAAAAAAAEATGDATADATADAAPATAGGE